MADLAGGVKEFAGNIVVLGFGSIGSGLMPLLFDRFVEPRVRVVTSDDRNLGIAQEYGVEHHVEAITESNYAGVLERHVSPGDFLVNLTVDVDSLDVVKWCAGGRRALHRHGHRAVGGLLHGRAAPGLRAVELVPSSACPRPPRRRRGRADRDRRARRQSRARQPLRQGRAPADRRRERHRREPPPAGRLERAGPDARDQGRPRRRAGHTAQRRTEGAGRVRQHVVGRRLHLRGVPAVGARLGDAREGRCRQTATRILTAATRRSTSTSPG